jgi:hypothetical protein
MERGQRGLRSLNTCRSVKLFLVRAALVRLIVLPAPRVTKLATMLHSAAEGTAEIPTSRIAGMRTKANPAVAAAHGAVLQIRTIPQDRLQRLLILTNKRTRAVVLMPILAKRENVRDGYGKIARFSVKMLIVLSISSSYSLDAKAARCRARIFYAAALKTARRIHTNDPLLSNSPIPSFCQADSSSPRASRSYLERKTKVLTGVVRRA